MVNRTHIESGPFIGFTGQIYVTLLSFGTERVIDHIYDLVVRICVERDLIHAKGPGRFSLRTFRPINDEAGRVGIEFG
jgi:hypothetical protein